MALVRVCVCVLVCFPLLWPEIGCLSLKEQVLRLTVLENQK